MISRSAEKENEVTISSLLNSIEVFHNVIFQEYPGAPSDHPYLELFPDGSGHIVGTRNRLYKIKEYPDGVLFRFNRLNELVAEADRLMEKYWPEKVAKKI